jgi:hypothetical protein
VGTEHGTGDSAASSKTSRKYKITRILVCGSRHWKDRDTIREALMICEDKFGDFILIHGNCPDSADTMAGEVALKLEMPVLAVPARWTRYGNPAGPIRNEWMLRAGRPDLVIAFHSDIKKSKGTAHMVRIAREAGVPVVVVKGDLEGFPEKLDEARTGF